MNLPVLYLAAYALAAFALGWAVARRAPDGIEYRAWLRLTRRLSRWRAAFPDARRPV